MTPIAIVGPWSTLTGGKHNGCCGARIETINLAQGDMLVDCALKARNRKMKNMPKSKVRVQGARKVSVWSSPESVVTGRANFFCSPHESQQDVGF